MGRRICIILALLVVFGVSNASGQAAFSLEDKTSLFLGVGHVDLASPRHDAKFLGIGTTLWGRIDVSATALKANTNNITYAGSLSFFAFKQRRSGFPVSISIGVSTSSRSWGHLSVYRLIGDGYGFDAAIGGGVMHTIGAPDDQTGGWAGASVIYNHNSTMLALGFKFVGTSSIRHGWSRKTSPDTRTISIMLSEAY